jgi:sulfur-oxidizing protein SoxZ
MGSRPAHIRAARRAARVVAIRTLIQHPMESGYRPGADGEVVPRDILRRSHLHLRGEVVFSAELSPAIAAIPFCPFPGRRQQRPGRVRWEGDNGFSQSESGRSR